MFTGFTFPRVDFIRLCEMLVCLKCSVVICKWAERLRASALARWALKSEANAKAAKWEESESHTDLGRLADPSSLWYQLLLTSSAVSVLENTELLGVYKHTAVRGKPRLSAVISASICVSACTESILQIYIFLRKQQPHVCQSDCGSLKTSLNLLLVGKFLFAVDAGRGAGFERSACAQDTATSWSHWLGGLATVVLCCD